MKVQVRHAINELHGKNHGYQRPEVPEHVSEYSDKAKITDNDINLVKSLVPKAGFELEAVAKPNHVQPPVAAPAPPAAKAQTEADNEVEIEVTADSSSAAKAEAEEAKPTGL